MMSKIYPDNGRPKKWPEITREASVYLKSMCYCLNGICNKLKREKKGRSVNEGKDRSADNQKVG
ncbi:MAG: hypothetical protein ACP5KW_10600 [Thermoproteota archaeon]